VDDFLATPWVTRDLDPVTPTCSQESIFLCVHNNVVVGILKLTPVSWDYFRLKKDKFTFVTTSGLEIYNGPMVLKVLLEDIDPTCSVNIECCSRVIEKSRLRDFKNNVTEMIQHIENHHLVIVSNSHTYDTNTYFCHLLTALLSSPNNVFNTNVQAIKSDVDSGYGFNAKVKPRLDHSCQVVGIIIKRCSDDPKDPATLALTAALRKIC